MNGRSGRHAADAGDSDDTGLPGIPAPAQDDADYRRPAGVDDGFAPHHEPPAYTPPPPTVAPAEQEAFGPPPGGAAYDAPPGVRLTGRPIERPAVPWIMTEAFGATPQASGGFDPAPGTRIVPGGAEPESPWWRHDALRDPWRDPTSPFWLGRGAVFAAGRPAQLDPTEDVASELDDDIPPPETDEDEPPESPSAGGRRGRFGLRAVVLGVLIALVAGALGGGAGFWLAQKAQDELHRSDVHLAQVGGAANRPPGSVADIAKRVGPAVVSIAVQTPSEYAVGSGVVVDRHGYVITNNHVVAPATGSDASIIVTFSDEATAKARIVGRDPISDLAVIKVPDEDLTVATLGKSSSLAVGDPVIAIGSPLGLNGTVTSGIVSALDRAVHVFGDDGTSDAYLDAIQTDAAINPGNSGGALVDAHGALVGINSAAALSSTSGTGQDTPASGIGYAIPIDYARGIADQLIKSGKAVHASLDAQGRTATAGLQEGAYLEQIVPHGAAANAGLRKGDVIVVADGHSIVSYDQLVVLVQQRKPGDKIDVTYFHGATKRTTTVTLGSA